MSMHVQALNRKLLEEAGTVYHETGLTPRQLADRCAELEKALGILSAYPLEEFGMEKSSDCRPLFGANEWQLQTHHVRAARNLLAKGRIP